MHLALYKPFKLQSGSLTLKLKYQMLKQREKEYITYPTIHPVTTEMPLRAH